MNSIKEGSAKILLPAGKVFYNPAQCVNRDLSVAVIKTFLAGKVGPHKVLEALSATGLRSVRYANELGPDVQIIANDIDPRAVELIQQNVVSNSVSEKVSTSCRDANFLMYSLLELSQHQRVIDLDPYGSASPFLEAAIQSIEESGLLCVTCTDMAVLCSSYPESCFSKYCAVPVKGEVCYEVALRIVISLINRIASKYKKHVEPLISCHIDFYVRVFVSVHHSPKEAKLAAARSSYLLQCVDCKKFDTAPVLKLDGGKFSCPHSPTSPCAFCGGRIRIGGPIWSEPIHNREFVAKLVTEIEGLDENIYAQKKRILGLTSMIKEEIDAPLYISIPESCHIIRCPEPNKLAIIAAIKNAGYLVSLSHCNAEVLKTTIPHELFYSILKQFNESRGVVIKSTYKFSDVVFDFTSDQSMIPDSKRKKLSRFPDNPANWGPLAKPKSS